MNTLTLQATFCGLLHGLGKLAFRADKTAADLLAAGSDAARCTAFARSLSVTADTPPPNRPAPAIGLCVPFSAT